MLGEYAVDPEGVASMQNPVAFLDLFGVDTGRMLTNHRKPRKWLADVMNSAARQLEHGRLSQKQFMRLEDLVRDLKTSAEFQREKFLPENSLGRHFDGNLCWLEATLKEHSIRPFEAVIADDPRADFAPVDADSAQHRFQVMRHLEVPQTEGELQKALSSLLNVSREVWLVDPYFKVSEARFKRVIQTLCTSHPHLQEVTVVLADRKGEIDSGTAIWDMKKLALPASVRVHVNVLKERPDGPQFHNRFVLTNVAGVIVDPGLGTSGSPGHQYMLNMMPSAQFHQRLREYRDGEGFDVLESLSIH